MNVLSRLWRALRGAESPSVTDLLAEARALVAAGELDRASSVYWRIPRRDLTLESLVEHAELLLQLGDHFGAAAKAARARDRDPDNARALAVQRRIREMEERERPGRRRDEE